MININTIKEDFYLFFLNDKDSFKVKKDFDKFNLITNSIRQELYYNNCYQVQSNVSNEAFLIFLDYWINDIEPSIDSNNIYELLLLSQEFGIMKEKIKRSDLQEQLKYSILKSLIHNVKKDHTKAINYVSQNLDYYLSNHMEEMYEIPISSLYNIFYNENRILKDHKRAYKFIKNSKKSQYNVLLDSLNGYKLSIFTFFYLFKKRYDHFNFCPETGSFFNFFSYQRLLIFLIMVILFLCHESIFILYQINFCKNMPLIKHKSFVTMKKEADLGVLSSIYYYGLILYDTDIDGTNKKMAAHYFRIGAEKGHLQCILKYAKMLDEGDGIEVNKTGAVHYFKIGADFGDLYSTLKYKKFLETQKCDDNNERERAIYTQKAYELGDLDSTYKFALMLLNGFGVRVDIKKAAILMKKAADRGHSKSKFKYGLMLLKGIGVDSNVDLGISYIKKVENENINAKYYISCINKNISFDKFVFKDLNLEEPLEDDYFNFLNVTTHSLGRDVYGGDMSVIVPRLTSIPTELSLKYQTIKDNQTEINFNVYEGESKKADENKCLYHNFIMDGIMPAPKGVAKSFTTYKINEEGILEVYVLDESTGNIKKKTIKTDKSIVLHKEIFNIIESKKELESIWLQICDRFLNKNLVQKLSLEIKNKINKEIFDSFVWIYDHQNDEVSLLEIKLYELERNLNVIIENSFKD